MATKGVKDFVVGLFADEGRLLDAVKRIRKEGLEIHDAYTPYAVHGLDQAMGLRPSHLPFVTFAVRGIAMIFALGFQFWSAGVDWPINVGGKPNDSSLAFLPVTFEVTVLFSALATAAAFFFKTRLFPGNRPVLIHPRVTDDVFVLVLEKKDASFNDVVVRKILSESGATEIQEKTVVS